MNKNSIPGHPMSDHFVQIPLGANAATRADLAAQAAREGKLLVGTVQPSPYQAVIAKRLAKAGRIGPSNGAFLSNLEQIAAGEVTPER